MSNTTTALQKKDDRNTLEAILARPAYAERFKQVLGEKAAQFCSSLVSVGRELGEDTDPKTIIGSAMKAACLDLPIDKNLGFAWIVPYKKQGKKLAQFQMGFRGYIQLAQRTGYYAGMNACPINKEAYNGRDSLGEPIIDWDKLDETKTAVGYFFGFKMVNGFVKSCYWTKEKVEAHAKKYSQAYRSDYDTPWKTHFDKMALKTVISNELSDWGIMSVQFQLARKADQAIVRDIDGEPEYIDTGAEVSRIEDAKDEHKPEPTGHQQATGQTTTTQAPEKKSGDVSKQPGNVVQLPQDKPAEQQAAGTPDEAQTTQATQEAKQEPDKTEALPVSEDPKWAFVEGDSDAVKSIKTICKNAGLSFNQLLEYLRSKKLARENQSDLAQLASTKLEAINQHVSTWVPEIGKLPK